MEITIDDALQRGVAAHKEGKLQDAERLYRAILQSQPAHPDANHNLGVLALSVNKVSEAIPLFKAALEANPRIEQFWLSYIDALIKEKKHDGARQVLEQAKQQGVALEKLQVFEEQLSSKVQPSGSANPSKEQLDRLLDHYQKGRFAEAEKLATSLTIDFPDHPFSWQILGAVFARMNRHAKAIEAIKTSVELSPDDAAPLFNLGVAFKEMGRLDEAEASYRQAINIDPNVGQYYLSLSNVLWQRGKLDEAANFQIKGLGLTSEGIGSNSDLKSAIPKFVRKVQQQNGIQTFFDNYMFSQLTVSSKLPIDVCNIFEQGQISKNNRFISFSERIEDIPASLPSGRLFDGIPFASSQGIHSLIKWKGHSLFKASYDLILYWMIIQEIKPDVIIELGSGDGGSAIWLADVACALGINTHVYSYDINKAQLIHEKVTFIEVDLMQVNHSSRPPYWDCFSGKKLLIEDAHVNLTNILNVFDSILERDDYLIVEDSDNKQEIIRDFALKKEPRYRLDRFFLDFFGTNITSSKNSIFKVF